MPAPASNIQYPSSAATLRQSAEEVVLHPTTTSLATCAGTAQLSQPTIWHFRPQTPRASSHDTEYPPLEYVDMFMDDFILLTQGPLKQQQQQQQEDRQVLLECLDLVVQPLDHSDRPERKEAASIKQETTSGRWMSNSPPNCLGLVVKYGTPHVTAARI